MPEGSWTKVALVAAGSAAAAALIWYVMFDELETEEALGSTPADERALAIEVINDLYKQRTAGPDLMKKMVVKLKTEKLSFEELYTATAKDFPEDPLSKPREGLPEGLNPEQLDKLISKFQYDPEIRPILEKVLSAEGGAPDADGAEPLPPAPFDKLLVIHKFMLKCLKEALVEAKKKPEFYTRPDVLIFASQTVVASKTEQEHKYTHDQIEAGTSAHQAKLSAEPEFMTVQLEMQRAMQEFFGGMPGMGM